MQRRLIAAVVSLMVFGSSFAADLTLKECSLNTRPVGLNEMVFTADGTDYMQLSDDLQRVERYDIKSGKLLSVVMDTKELNKCNVEYWDGFILSPNEKLLLLYTDSEEIYRHS